jgi:hypothetical protein
MGTEIIRAESGQANEIEAAGILARELSYPTVSKDLGKVAGLPNIQIAELPTHKTQIIGTFELSVGEMNELQAAGHKVRPIGWGIAVE